MGRLQAGYDAWLNITYKLRLGGTLCVYDPAVCASCTALASPDAHRLFLAFVKAASDAHAALEHLDAHNGDAMPSSSTHVATAIDELLRCRARLGDLLRDVAEFSPAGATYRAPDAAASPEPHQQQPQAGIAEEPTEQGEEGEEAARGRHIPGMAVIQAAWSRAAHAAGALGDALHLHPGSQDAAGGGAGSEERQQQQQQQRKSSAWPFGGAEASYVTAAAAVLDAEAFDVGNEAAGNPQQLPQLPVYHAPKPPPLRLTAALRAAMQHTADTAAAARDRVTALLHNAVAAASQAIATAKAATLPRPPRHPHPAIAARKAAEAAAAAAQAAADAAGSSSHKAWGGIRSIGALLWAPVQAVRERVGGWHGPAPEAATAGAGDAVADATAEALDAKLMRVWRSAVEQLEASAARCVCVWRNESLGGTPVCHCLWAPPRALHAKKPEFFLLRYFSCARIFATPLTLVLSVPCISRPCPVALTAYSACC